MARAFVCVWVAYALLNLFNRNREEFWILLALAGVLFVALFLPAIMSAKGYRWRRGVKKTLPLAKEGENV